jgi:hypothetical protein
MLSARAFLGVGLGGVVVGWGKGGEMTQTWYAYK